MNLEKFWNPHALAPIENSTMISKPQVHMYENSIKILKTIFKILILDRTWDVCIYIQIWKVFYFWFLIIYEIYESIFRLEIKFLWSKFFYIQYMMVCLDLKLIFKKLNFFTYMIYNCMYVLKVFWESKTFFLLQCFTWVCI